MIRTIDRLRFGPAGIPNSYNGPAEGALEYLQKLGLDAMELEFVRNVWLKPERAEVFKELSKKYDILLTAHAPYYINLNSADKSKVEASIKRIFDAAKALYLAGGFSVVFHAAFYHKDDPSKVTERVVELLRKLEEQLKDAGIDVWIRPETMGKPSQWGTVKEIVRVSEELEMVEPAIDFAHLHAREGKMNSPDEWRDILSFIEDRLGSEALKRMHIHVSGIVYGNKGEKHHVNLKEADLKYRELLEVLKEFNVKGALISESPNLEEDAMLMKKVYEDIDQ